MTDISFATTSHSDTQSNATEYNELLLIEQAQNGCQDSMCELFSHNEIRVKRFIERKIGNSHTVEDILQESLIKAFQSIQNFSGRSKFSTWIIGIALNVVRNHCNRSPEYKYDWVSDEHLMYQENDTYNIERQTMLDQSMSELIESFQNLPEQFKDVINMAAVDGLSYTEIAEKIGITPQAVKSRLFRARKMLRNDLEDDYLLSMV